MVLQSTRKGNSIYDEMKERLHQQFLIERQSAYETYSYDYEVVEAIDMINDNYSLNLFKLDELIELTHKSEELQLKLINQKDYIEKLGIPEKSKIESVLTTACILNKVGDLAAGFNENELFIISCVLLNTSPQDYDKYKMIVDNFSNAANTKNDSIEKTKQYTI